MKSQFEEAGKTFERREALQHELDACKQRLAEVEQLLGAYKNSETLLQGEQRLTEKIARGEALQEIFEEACKLVEHALQGSLAIILLLDGNRLRRGAAPSLSKYIDEVDGFQIDPNVGTCSAAAARKERVITSDITKDPNWALYLDLAAKHGLGAGWATPILSSTDAVLGTFGLYWPESRSPSPQQIQIIDQVVRLLALAIQRKLHLEALGSSEKLARDQAEAMTQTLDALAREIDPKRAMEHVLLTVTTQFDAASCSIWLRDQVSGLLENEFAFEDGVFKTRDDTNLSTLSPSMAAEAVPAWVEMFRTKKPVSLEDLRLVPDFPCRSHLLRLGLIAVLTVPMIIAGKVEGFMGIRFSRKRKFSIEERDLAQVLANQALLAIQMARLSAKSHHTAIAEERNRVARDIHDTLAQSFTGVIAHLEAARGAASKKKSEKVSDHLEQAGELAREGLREARRSVQALRPLELEEKPLKVALRDLIERMTTGMRMKGKFSSKGEILGLPLEWETNLLRIGQELLTNSIRHSEASNFDALLVFETNEIHLVVEDNGRGFNAMRTHKGFGIRGIRERVKEMGGKFIIQSGDGKGTIISIIVPFKTPIPLGDI